MSPPGEPRRTHLEDAGSAAGDNRSSEAVLNDLAHPRLRRLRAEVGEDPGRSCLVPRVKLSAGFEIDHELEGLIVASLLRDLAAELGQCLWSRSSIRKSPSQRTARRTGRRWGQQAATQMGILGVCAGGARTRRPRTRSGA